MLLCAAAAFIGLAIAYGGVMVAAFFTALIGFAIGLTLPLRWFVALVFVTSFLLTGQLTYFAGISKALWLPFLLGVLLWVRLPIDLMQSQQSRVATHMPSAVKAGLFVYFATLVTASAINAIPLLQLFVSAKEYSFIWSILALLAFGLYKREALIRLWALLPWLMPLQLPLVLYQRFVIAPSRSSKGIGAAWDAIVGAFGGNQNAGGASGAMGLFCIVAIGIVVARWRQGLMSGRLALFLAACGLLSVGLAEVKFAVVVLPFAFAILFFSRLRTRPLETALALVLSVVLSFAGLIAYKVQFSVTGADKTVGEYVSSVFQSRSNDADFINMRTREMGRVAALKFWLDEHSLSEPDKLLMGHGAGASRVGDVVVGAEARRYPFLIARSSMAILLWEVGLIGFAAICLALAAGFVSLLRLSVQTNLSGEMRATAASMAVAVALIGLELPYNTDFLFAHQIQLLLFAALGFLCMSSTAPLPRPVMGSSPASR